MALCRVALLATFLSFLQKLLVDGLQHVSNSYGSFSGNKSVMKEGHFTTTRSRKRRRCHLNAANMYMDVEEGFHERELLRRFGAFDNISLRNAQTRNEMPWMKSITSYTPPPTHHRVDEDGSPLLFMSFWTRQMKFLQDNLTNLRPTSMPRDMQYRENDAGNARLVNHCLQSDEYRKIRMTYYDAGDNCQVFNSLWYPHPRYDLPVLGIDLLAFNRRPVEEGSSVLRGRYLSVIDFQPTHDDEADHAVAFSEVLGSIRSDYPSLQGTMSSRFYDHSQHFSSQMLYGRGESEESIKSELAPAFDRSMEAHLQLLRDTTPDDSESSMKRVLNCQARYDSYSSLRDPAKALFTKMFGESWAEKYVFDFLFDLSERPPNQ